MVEGVTFASRKDHGDDQKQISVSKRREPHRLREDTVREELFLSRMRAKQNYMPNPRFSVSTKDALQTIGIEATM